MEISANPDGVWTNAEDKNKPTIFRGNMCKGWYLSRQASSHGELGTTDN